MKCARQCSRILPRWAALLSCLAAAALHAAPPNDYFADRAPLQGTTVFVAGGNQAATVEASEPYHAGESGGASVWWSWTAPKSGKVIIDTAGSSFDTLLAVYTGNNLEALVEVASSDDADEEVLTSAVTFLASSGQSYQIAVDGYDAEMGQISLHLEETDVPQAPAWTLEDMTGAPCRSTDYAGQVLIIDFWATWCGPCKVEIPDFIALQDKYRRDGLMIIGLSLDDYDPPKLIDFIGQYGMNYPVLWSTTGVESDFGGVSAIPTTFVVDRRNRLVQKFVGTQSRTTFEREILPLLYDDVRLQAATAAGDVQLRWPITAAHFIVEYSSDPQSPLWRQVSAAPQIQDNWNVIQLPANTPCQLYRLRLLP